jgi:RNA recognition motif-containing protein
MLPGFDAAQYQSTPFYGAPTGYSGGPVSYGGSEPVYSEQAYLSPSGLPVNPTQGVTHFEYRSVHVSNIAYNVKPKYLANHFEKIAPVVRVEMPSDPSHRGHNKGFAQVFFHNEEDTRAAVEQGDGSTLHGRMMRVRLDSEGVQPTGIQYTGSG